MTKTHLWMILNNHSKRQNLFLWFKQQKYDIILLQETYCTEKLDSFIKNKATAAAFISRLESVIMEN